MEAAVPAIVGWAIFAVIAFAFYDSACRKCILPSGICPGEQAKVIELDQAAQIPTGLYQVLNIPVIPYPLGTNLQIVNAATQCITGKVKGYALTTPKGVVIPGLEQPDIWTFSYKVGNQFVDAFCFHQPGELYNQ